MVVLDQRSMAALWNSVQTRSHLSTGRTCLCSVTGVDLMNEVESTVDMDGLGDGERQF